MDSLELSTVATSPSIRHKREHLRGDPQVPKSDTVCCGKGVTELDGWPRLATAAPTVVADDVWLADHGKELQGNEPLGFLGR